MYEHKTTDLSTTPVSPGEPEFKIRVEVETGEQAPLHQFVAEAETRAEPQHLNEWRPHLVCSAPRRHETGRDFTRCQWAGARIGGPGGLYAVISTCEQPPRVWLHRTVEKARSVGADLDANGCGSSCKRHGAHYVAAILLDPPAVVVDPSS